ncbi:MAG: hypothetical protein WA151_11935 [Desulfatirhabdiaceae bacterium]
MSNDEKFVAYDSENSEWETFETQKDAEAWLLDCSEGSIGLSAMTGGSFIAKITHRTEFRVTDKKENYQGDESWPYNPDYDEVGEIVFVETEN